MIMLLRCIKSAFHRAKNPEEKDKNLVLASYIIEFFVITNSLLQYIWMCISDYPQAHRHYVKTQLSEIEPYGNH